MNTSPTKPVSRQAVWQRAMRARGLCPQCGKEPLAPGLSRGLKCLVKNRERQRVMIGAVRRYGTTPSYVMEKGAKEARAARRKGEAR